MSRYLDMCRKNRDDDDCDGSGTPPAVPRWIDEMVNRPVEPPPDDGSSYRRRMRLMQGGRGGFGPAPVPGFAPGPLPVPVVP